MLKNTNIERDKLTDKLNIKAEWTFTTEPTIEQKKLFTRLLREREITKEMESERQNFNRARL